MSKKNLVQSPYGSAAGSGIFLQGSGQLNFNLESQDTYTIDDDIVDETGAVRAKLATSVPGTKGPDGLFTGGGDGIWTINQTGKGKLVIKGSNLLSGNINVSGGILDLSSCSNINSQSLLFKENTTLVHKPAGGAPSALAFQELSISESTVLHLNGYSRISAEQITFPNKFSITVDFAGVGFTPGASINVITWETPINSMPEVTVSDGYTCSIGKNSISIIKNQ